MGWDGVNVGDAYLEVDQESCLAECAASQCKSEEEGGCEGGGGRGQPQESHTRPKKRHTLQGYLYTDISTGYKHIYTYVSTGYIYMEVPSLHINICVSMVYTYVYIYE